MFIKIIRGSHESLYECTAYHMEYDREKQEFIITMEGAAPHADALSVSVQKDVPEALAVYVMNSKGQTVDTIFHKKEGKL